MKHPYRLPVSVAVLAMALAIALPSAAGAKSKGHGKHGRDHPSEARGGHSGKREYSRDGGSRSFGERAYAHRAGDRERADWRGSGSRGDVRDRDPRADHRADVRWRDSDRRHHAPSYRPRTHYRASYSNYRPRSYFTGSYHRPRFVSHSGFSLGSVPSYGYRYFDPYCDIGFSNLGAYYDHCYYHGHPDVILVLDIRSGYPIASCAYRGGYWVVDHRY